MANPACLVDSPATFGFPKCVSTRDQERSENRKQPGKPPHVPLHSSVLPNFALWPFINPTFPLLHFFPPPPNHPYTLLLCLEKMYESVDVAGLNSSSNSFFMMDFYNQNRACLIQDKGPGGNANPYSTPVRNQHWNSSNHCTYLM